MSVRSRLIFLLLAFIALIAVGLYATGSFDFVLHHFWFVSGFFLLLLLSLIDQPYFSKDANVFVNGTTGWVSLLLVDPTKRTGVWWGFFVWTCYLIVSSYALMWVRSKELGREGRIVQTVSRINRQIGRPEALFSALFLWGCVQQFGMNSPQINPLFLFWAVFMILNLPALAGAIDRVFSGAKSEEEHAGVVVGVISPRIVEAAFSPNLPSDVVGKSLLMKADGDQLIATAVIVDDRIVAGKRVGRLAITEAGDAWRRVAQSGREAVRLELPDNPIQADGAASPISIVDAGSEIDKLVFHVHPNQPLEAGEVLWVQKDRLTKAFYQVISAVVCQFPLHEGNFMHTVKVSAGQLGVWDNTSCRFEPITWVAPAGNLIHSVPRATAIEHAVPDRCESVGRVPHSAFPVHVSVEDIVTHNTAMIGVTGSGKSYLAFHLIESILKNEIKVLILDISREHDLYLAAHSPTAIKTAAEVEAWFNSDSRLGIHQFGVDAAGYPKITADFVTAAFNELSKTKLQRGKNIPARLCIVLEEAHSLIPEWNQVAQQADVGQVNRTARNHSAGPKVWHGHVVNYATHGKRH
ncbi:MAG: hypothetical protein QOG23_2389 [Blastocatellia bacterium]|jgi:hypothetical protein|nr:hypothetical protein [Blastocatellia bacterium]